MESVYQI